ncbi:MAG: PilZ domain [Acidimicrobiia bacterium]|nr:PilZ domain [Acidimicrobiia bacterium]
MQLASLHLRSRIVLQVLLDDDSVTICATELAAVHEGTVVLRPLDDLPESLAGHSATLLVGGPECLLRVAGIIVEQELGAIHIEVEEEIEEIQRRRFARLTGWLPVSLRHGAAESAGTMVDVSLGGAAVLTAGYIEAGELVNLDLSDGGSAQATVVGVTALDTGVRRLHLQFDEHDEISAAVARSLFDQLAD